MIKTVIKSLSELESWWEANKQPVMGFDTETTSLNYVEMDWIGCSFATGTASCYIDLMYPGDISRYRLQRYFDDIELIVIHKASFDLKVLYKYGIEVKSIFCTLTGAQLLNENLFSHGLKYLAENWLKIPPDQIKKWEEVSTNTDSAEFADYGMNDSIWAYQLYELESKALKKQGLEHLFYEVEMPFQFVLRDLEINGVAVDREEYESAKKDLSDLLEETLIEVCESADIKYWYDTDLLGNKMLSTSINFNSSPQIIKLIEEKLGFEVTERTKPSKTHPKGQKSFNAKVKASFKGKHPFFDLFAKYDELSTLLGTFMLPLEGFIDSDGIVRTSYGMKRTGRLSSSRPNLQNQPNPKKKKLIYNYRKIFVPGE